MNRVPGQITRRLPVGNPDADAWTYQSPEETTDARAAVGYRIGSRWREVRRIQRRRRRAALIQAAVLALLCGGAVMALGIGDEMYKLGGTGKAPFCYTDHPVDGVRCYRDSPGQVQP